jgi:N-acetylglucosaminyldiphosphoundecaprenol N-acetyl-beta-D-mannosaminyltransferase
MDTVDIAGLRLNSVTKKELLTEIEKRIHAGQKTSVITPYSEFLVAGLRDSFFMELLNKATYSIPDGIGILWANLFLSKPLTLKSYYGKIVQAFMQMVMTGASILLNPKTLYRIFPEKIVGADFFWDLLAMAESGHFSVYLLGAEGDVPKKAKTLVEQKYPNLNIVGSSNKMWDDPTILTDIQIAAPDMVFVFFPHRKQERWIFEHSDTLTTKFIIGLGGTLDYAVGAKTPPPRFIRAAGLEWLFRLITQPSRFRRIWNAFVGLITALVRYKVFSSMPYRRNAVVIIQHADKTVLVCQRNPESSAYGSGREGDHRFADYWQFPQGGIDEVENIETGARREAFEEVGLTDLEFLKIHRDAYAYEWRNAVRQLLLNPLKYKGQNQSLVYFTFTGEKDSVKIDNHELVNYQWVEPHRLPDVLHAERSILAHIAAQDLSE